MSKIIILGAGMVGKAMAIDLSKKHNVTSADIDKSSLDYLSKNYNIKTVVIDVNKDEDVKSAVKDFDLVISAVPGFLGMKTMINVIKCNKNLVDISFLPEDVMHLNSLAKEHNVSVVMDCGVAPGMPNFIVGYHNELMKVESMEYMVGGLPKTRTFPFEYKAPFSPCDVIEEYTRPARYMENGHVVVKPAMSDTEFIDFPTVGTLEAFNSDGLRSLVYTLNNIPNMKEKTLRYPGHIKLIQAFKAAGFFSKQPVSFNGQSIIPFDFTTKLIFDAWKLGPEEPEFTVMRVIIQGIENGLRKEIIYDLFDEYDPKEKLSSMARTTGFTATATAEMILEGKFTDKGVFPPELVGKKPECFTYILKYLSERNIQYNKKEKVIQ
jgi:saccharopine dehydrogenase-like NADP-dependent oxidoreductase